MLLLLVAVVGTVHVVVVDVAVDIDSDIVVVVGGCGVVGGDVVVV